MQTPRKKQTRRCHINMRFITLPGKEQQVLWLLHKSEKHPPTVKTDTLVLSSLKFATLVKISAAMNFFSSVCCIFSFCTVCKCFTEYMCYV